MTEPNIEERLQRIKEERAKAKKPCICKVGDPCDYHAATCITCHPRCGGHPTTSFSRCSECGCADSSSEKQYHYDGCSKKYRGS